MVPLNKRRDLEALLATLKSKPHRACSLPVQYKPAWVSNEIGHGFISFILGDERRIYISHHDEVIDAMHTHFPVVCEEIETAGLILVMEAMLS